MGMVIVVIAIVLWISHKKTGNVGVNGAAGSGFKLPDWLFKGIGIFLLIMLILNVSEVWIFVKSESNNWWPLVKESGHNFSKQLREFFGYMSEGGGK
ncbi:hypothetical protein [Paenibacillus amylolyticus]|uniref:Uncharacterized protein n=1 Tax=Paenibacillus amylolyticus TaxID=1451 RepID=A0ABD8B3B6_PAEAM